MISEIKEVCLKCMFKGFRIDESGEITDLESESLLLAENAFMDTGDSVCETPLIQMERACSSPCNSRNVFWRLVNKR